MKKQLILLFTLAFAGIFSAAAQDPIYVVNGQVVSDIRNIPPGDIESTEMLPADEQTIARYGTEASNGVILITLRYDTPARFPEADGSFNDYISEQTDWDDSLPAARVVLRYKITTDGRTVPTDELEATDRRLRRRVIDAWNSSCAKSDQTAPKLENELALRMDSGHPAVQSGEFRHPYSHRIGPGLH